MRTRLPPNVTVERNRHGKRVFYYRVGKGARTRLPDYGTPEFDAAYQAALRGEPAAPVRLAKDGGEGTLAWLVAQYRMSLHFRSLDMITQRRRESFFAQMIKTAGSKRITAITEKSIIDGRERRTHGKGHAANNFLKAIKPMFAYAKTRGWIEVDPAKTVDFVKPLKGGRLAWTIDDVQKFEKCHPPGTMPHLAMRILLFTGFRRADAVKFGRQHIKDGVVTFRPGKTEKTSGVSVTFTALPPLLDAIEAVGATDRLTFLVTRTGQPFKSAASFGNWFEERCIEAKVEARAHGLRKLGPTLAAEAGATAHELMAMWGWTTLAQAQLYTITADRKRLGGAAAEKLLGGYANASREAKP